jgi:thiamine-monophosphate kinase
MTKPLSGEPALIEALARIFGAAPPEVVLGIGDDCAVLDLGGPDYLLWTVDTLMEGVHFDLGYTTLRQLGRKSLAVNLSDVAAMGGTPRYALLSLAWPKERDTAGALELGQGLAELGREYGVAVIGGDSVAAGGGVAVTVTVLGTAPKGEMVRRAGARAGDRVLVTGPLGEAAAGLEVLKRRLSLEPALREPLCQALLDPRPQLQAGRLLASKRLASAMIDLSDGVATDLYHVCRASGVGARLHGAAIPVSPRVRAVAQILDQDPLDLALKGGEDYQLLFTTPPALAETLDRAFRQAGLPPPLFLGEIIPGDAVLLQTSQGMQEISGAGFNHFRLDLEGGSV